MTDSGYIFDPAFHGPWVASLAVAGIVLLGIQVLAQGISTPTSLHRLMLLLYPPTYTLIYVMATTRAKQNHFLQVLPFTSLLAAVAIDAGWRRLSEHLPVPRRRGLLLAAAPLALWLAVKPLDYVYRQVTPSTATLVADTLRQALPEPRASRAVYATTALSLPAFGSALFSVNGLPAAGEVALDFADAEVFPARELSGPAGEFHRRRLEAAVGSIHVTRRLFGAWGPDLIVLFHPWRIDDIFMPAQLHARDPAGVSLVVPLPRGLERGDVVSAQVRLPVRPKEARDVSLTVGSVRLVLVPVRRVRGEEVFLTPRFSLEAASSTATVELLSGRLSRGTGRIIFQRWLSPLSGDTRLGVESPPR